MSPNAQVRYQPRDFFRKLDSSGWGRVPRPALDAHVRLSQDKQRGYGSGAYFHWREWVGSSEVVSLNGRALGPACSWVRFFQP